MTDPQPSPNSDQGNMTAQNRDWVHLLDEIYDLMVETLHNIQQIREERRSEAQRDGDANYQQEESCRLPNEEDMVTISQEQVDNDQMCAICIQDFTIGDRVIQLPCHHCFHTPCILPWLEQHSSCPLCRQRLRRRIRTRILTSHSGKVVNATD